MAAQALQRGLAELAGPAGAEAAADALRIVDTYIKVCSHCCLRVGWPWVATKKVYQARAPSQHTALCHITGVADGESQYCRLPFCANDNSAPLAGSLRPSPYTISQVQQLPYMPKRLLTMQAFTLILTCLRLTTGILSSVG